jgi:IS605 OrfB family transposase
MQTIKLPYTSSEDLTPILKQYSSVVHYSYNRFLEGKNEKEIRALIKTLNHVEMLNSWLVQCAIRDAKAVQNRFKEQKVIFGGRKNFIQRCKNLITKEEFDRKRLSPLTIQGEKLCGGNRMFTLNIIENNSIIFRLNKNMHITLELPNLRNNIKKELFKLQELNEKGSNGYTYTIKLDLKNVSISFEEFRDEQVEHLKLNDNRYMGIDLNPDTIGISILYNDKVIHAQEFSLKPLFNSILSQELSSDSLQMKHLQNKLKFETFEISKSIANLAKHFRCKAVFVEDLHFKQKLTKDQKHNHLGNRKNKNLWKRELFINNLTKRLNISGINIYSVNPAYSSFIGNIQYDYTDAVNASLEIARRGYEYRIKKNKKGFYPALLVKHHWKEMAAKYANWKEFYLEAKNLKLKYRVSLEECQRTFKVFQQNSSCKSKVLNYAFMVD